MEIIRVPAAVALVLSPSRGSVLFFFFCCCSFACFKFPWF